MPKISVIVPVYNTEKYLRKCLDSIVNQKYKDIEVIVINDGSTDSSQKIIDEYVEKYPIVKGFIKENGGLSDTRNYGITKATGEYISFIDSDDYINLELFSKLQKYIEEDIDLIKFKLIRVDGNYNEIEKIDGPIFDRKDGEDAFNELVFKDNYIEPACIYLYKRTLFEKNNYEFAKNRLNEDFGLIPTIVANSNSVSSSEFFGYYYLQTQDSITRNDNYEKKYKSAFDLLFHYDNMIIQLNKSNLKNETKQNMRQYYTNSIINAVGKLNKKDRKEYIKEIKQRKLIANIKPKNFKQIIKKMILKINIKFYLKLNKNTV